jgi:hypothetical protein
MILRTFGWSLAVTAAGLVAAFLLGGPGTMATVAILAILEISVSFDNAVVNATVLTRLSPPWQRLFLTVGLLVAVFGMRLVFPLLVVGASARMGPVEAVRLALSPGHAYEVKLQTAHPVIAAFGGMFLLLLALDFFLAEREQYWLGWLERPLARLGRVPYISVIFATVVLLVIAGFFADDPPGPAIHASRSVTIAGFLGMAVYLVLKTLSDRVEKRTPGGTGGDGVRTGRAALLLFLYLEVLDASFSFDGVLGAFAITNSLFVIAAGLGIGAMYIRSMTVFLVHKGTLKNYVYLENGAHWAIAALATTMLVGIPQHVPDAVSGGLGAVIILASLLSSIGRNRRRGHPSRIRRPELSGA